MSAGFHGLRVVGNKRVVADGAVAELRGVGLAQHHGAGLAQALDDDVVLLRHEVGIQARAEGAAQALGADQVLDGDRHAAERADVLSGRQPRIERLGLRHGRVGRQRAEGMQLAVDSSDALQRRGRDLHAAPAPIAHRLRQRAGIEGEG